MNPLYESLFFFDFSHWLLLITSRLTSIRFFDNSCLESDGFVSPQPITVTVVRVAGTLLLSFIRMSGTSRLVGRSSLISAMSYSSVLVL